MLFQTYFSRCAPFFHILDPSVQDARPTLSLSPFLWICVCSIASLKDKHFQQVQHHLMELAEDMAGHAAINASDSLQSVQA